MKIGRKVPVVCLCVCWLLACSWSFESGRPSFRLRLLNFFSFGRGTSLVFHFIFAVFRDFCRQRLRTNRFCSRRWVPRTPYWVNVWGYCRQIWNSIEHAFTFTALNESFTIVSDYMYESDDDVKHIDDRRISNFRGCVTFIRKHIHSHSLARWNTVYVAWTTMIALADDCVLGTLINGIGATNRYIYCNKRRAIAIIEAVYILNEGGTPAGSLFCVYKITSFRISIRNNTLNRIYFH